MSLLRSSSGLARGLVAQARLLPCQVPMAAVQIRTLRSLADLESPLQSQSPQAKASTSSTATAAAAASASSSKASTSADATGAAKPAQPRRQNLVITLSCPDTKGIVHTVTGWLATRSFDIRDSAQYGDPSTQRFFMRVHALGPEGRDWTLEGLRQEFERDVGALLKMDWEINDGNSKPKTMIMVSKIGHCLHDLLYRHSVGTLPIDIPCIVSNHPTFATLAAQHNIPFHHLPIVQGNEESKKAQETKILELVKEHSIDLIVLARYMQILSPKLCQVMSSKIINIHHSLLPSFKGAKPFHQAHARGVKLIGATAHLVTSALDEGPIIEQDVERVDHSYAPEEMVKKGAEIEERVLARAVKWKAENRVLSNGDKTVVFS